MSGILVARLLGPENRGYLALLVLWPTVLFAVGGLGLPVSISYHVAKQPIQAGALMRLALVPIGIQAVVCVTIQSIGLVLFLASKPSSVRYPALITLAAIPLLLALDCGLAILQGQRRFAAFNFLRTVPATLYAAGVAVLFLLHDGDLVRVAAAWILALLFAAVGAFFVALKSMSTHEAVGQVPSRFEVMGFGIRGLLGSASPVETFRLDQAVVGLFLSPAALGLYVVGVAFTNLPRFLAQSLGMVVYPQVASQPDSRIAWRYAWKMFAVSAAVSTSAAVALAAAAGYLVPFFFGNEFRGAIEVARILLIGAAFLAARRVLSDGARGLGRPMTGTIAEAISWIWLAPAVVVLAPRLGVTGVAIAFASASFVSLAVALVAFLMLPGLTRPRSSVAA